MIEGAYIRIVGASAPTKRYKITPLLRGSPHPSVAGPGPPLCPDTPSVTSLSSPEAARIPEGRGAGPVRTPVRSYECVVRVLCV